MLDFDIDLDDLREYGAFLNGSGPHVIGILAKHIDLALAAVEARTVDRTPVNTGGLRASFGRDIDRRGDSVVGRVGTPLIYGLPVERGRRPGKRPPSAAIRMWVIRKGIASPGEADAVAFLIARAIGRRGTRGVHMLGSGWDSSKPDIDRELDRAFAEAMEYLARGGLRSV